MESYVFGSYTCFLGLMAGLDTLHKGLWKWGGLANTSHIISSLTFRHRTEEEGVMVPSMVAARMCAPRVDRRQGAATLTTAVNYIIRLDQNIFVQIILNPVVAALPATWGAWRGWTACSETCGGGVSWPWRDISTPCSGTGPDQEVQPGPVRRQHSRVYAGWPGDKRMQHRKLP